MACGQSTVSAVVREVDGGEALVEVADAGCGRCHEKGGCGGHNIARMLGSSPRRFRVTNQVGACVGDRVDVGIDEGVLLRGANLAYGLPLCGLLVGATFGAWAAGNPGALLGAGVGLGVAWGVLRRLVPSASLPRIVGRS